MLDARHRDGDHRVACERGCSRVGSAWRWRRGLVLVELYRVCAATWENLHARAGLSGLGIGSAFRMGAVTINNRGSLFLSVI